MDTKIIVSMLFLFFMISIANSQPTTSDSCVQYNSNFSTCQKCVQGFTLLIYFCIPCAPLCRCQNITNYCSSCMNITDKQKDVILFSYMNGDRCYFCNQTLLHCLQCQISNQQESPDSLVLVSSVAQNGVGTILKCLKCFQGYYLLSNGSCSQLKCDKNCQICQNQTQCSQCIAGHALNLTINRCFTNSCLSNCLNCTSQTTCSECALGYFPGSNNQTCQQCLQDCMFCKNAISCQACFPSFSYNGTACVNNSSPNCLAFSQGAGLCLVCQPGYYNSGGSCSQCNGCLLCSSPFVCYSQCQTGFTPFNYACVPNYSPKIPVSLTILITLMIFYSLFI